jgi:ankyrin repeat protein
MTHKTLWTALPATACIALAAASFSAHAQLAPSTAEVARYTGVHAVAHKGELAQVKKLLASGAPVNARDPYGRTALHVATFARQREVIKALVQAGADLGLLENDRYDAVTIASVADDEPTLRLLLELGASAKLTTSRYDGTALIAAAHLGHDGVVRQLIAAGAPLDHVNNLHWTAVIESIVLGDGGSRHQAVLQALLDAGASTRLADREGNSPLVLAKARGFQAMVVMIKKAGAR